MKKVKVQIKLKRASKKTAPKGNITYRTNKLVELAGLFNCRGTDLRVCPIQTGIKAGSIVLGTHGLCIAKAALPGIGGEVVSYKGNAQVKFGDLTVEAMVLNSKKNGPSNYCIINLGKKRFVQGELDTFTGQDKRNKAQLVKLF